MRHSCVLALIFFLLSSGKLYAAEAIYASVPDAAVVGHGELNYIFWDIYDATLYAPRGKWNPDKSFALSIEYHCDIDGKEIADRAIAEMRNQGFSNEIKLATWDGQMKSIFPDVKNGTVLSAIYIPGKQTVFYDGDKVIGAIKGDDFGKLFFGIWLSEKTSEPDLRRALLGIS
ncbi:MAG: chalcone isomerase family protein [Alphaproteobacteria bacterium]|nr:chalcone isomerase family protein [Alphaproteobacteria bacterium]